MYLLHQIGTCKMIEIVNLESPTESTSNPGADAFAVSGIGEDTTTLLGYSLIAKDLLRSNVHGHIGPWSSKVRQAML